MFYSSQSVISQRCVPCCAQNSSEFNAYQSLSRSMLRIPKLDSLSWVLTYWGFFVQSASFILLEKNIFFFDVLWGPWKSGAPGSRGPRFIEPPEPHVVTPLRMLVAFLIDSNSKKRHRFWVKDCLAVVWSIPLMPHQIPPTPAKMQTPS